MKKINLEKQANLFQFNQFLHKKIDQLYTQGNEQILASEQLKVAIIGSRCLTNYGRKILQQIIPGLVRNNLTIVSGGAFGIDIEAQKIALDYGGEIITVLGSGLQNPAPKSNAWFYDKVAKYKRGVVISEFEPDYHATKFSFPARNRIISALSDLIIIVEARQKSGALITADFAMQHSKPVACFPARIHDLMSEGTNQLIREGAHLVTSVQDILDILPKYKPIAQTKNIDPLKDRIQLTLDDMYK